MSNANNSEPERPAQGQLGAFPYVLGGLSFIPAIGVVFGISAVTWGLVTRKSGGRRVACIGFAGIAFTVILYTALFYFGFVQRGGVYDDLRSKMSQSTLSSVVPVIEMYKLQSGHYPESMAALKDSIPKDSPVFLFDPAIDAPGTGTQLLLLPARRRGSLLPARGRARWPAVHGRRYRSSSPGYRRQQDRIACRSRARFLSPDQGEVQADKHMRRLVSATARPGLARWRKRSRNATDSARVDPATSRRMTRSAKPRRRRDTRRSGA